VHIDWGTLATIGVVAAAAAVTVVLLVSFAIVGLSASSAQPVHGRDGGGPSGIRSASGVALAVVCLLAAGLIVCYGLYLIIG
jgi:hypothetical protein